MRRHHWPFLIFTLSVCLALTAFMSGCSQRRSEGQKPAPEAVNGDSAQNSKTANTEVGSDESVAPALRFENGVEPPEHKAQKLVNQLFNYCAGICANQQECPADLEAAKEATKTQYKFFWPKDPWGKPYQYKKIDDQHFDLWSAGPDGIDGNDDDIHVADSNRDSLPN